MKTYISKKLLLVALLSTVTQGVVLAGGNTNNCRNNHQDPLVGIWAGTIEIVPFGLYLPESAVVNADGTINYTGTDNTGTTAIGFTTVHVGKWEAIGNGKYKTVVTAINATNNVRELSKGSLTIGPDCQTFTGSLVSNFYAIPTTPPFTIPPFSVLTNFFPNTPVKANFYKVDFGTK